MPDRLDKLYSSLWLAGLAKPARPIHRQRLLGRAIVITEDPNEHLVWFERQIFMKPLPAFLFSHSFWTTWLCADEHLYNAACGLLVSYVWLIIYPSDLKIAQEANLLPSTITFDAWSKFVAEFINHIPPLLLGGGGGGGGHEHIHRRYYYGELRLSRMNMLARFLHEPSSSSSFPIRSLFQGYMVVSTWYQELFIRKFKWLIAAFAYLSVVLSGLQVGLSIGVLQDGNRFQNASYGFAIAAIIAVVLSAFIIFSVWFVLFWYHLLFALRFDRKAAKRRGRLTGRKDV